MFFKTVKPFKAAWLNGLSRAVGAGLIVELGAARGAAWGFSDGSQPPATIRGLFFL